MFTPTNRWRMSHFFALGWLREWTPSRGWAERGSREPGVDPHLSYGGTLPSSQVGDPTRRNAAAEQASQGPNLDS
jgi:hypothetical protein